MAIPDREKNADLVWMEVCGLVAYYRTAFITKTKNGVIVTIGSDKFTSNNVSDALNIIDTYIDVRVRARKSPPF